MESSNEKKHKTKNPLRKFLIDRFNANLILQIRELQATSILDLGCGEGYVCKLIKTAFPKVSYYGLDGSQQAVEVAKNKNLGVNFAVMDILDTSSQELNKVFNVSKFDTVICLEVIEHIEDFHKALSVLSNIDADHYIISAPNEPFFRLSNLIALKNIKRLGNDPGHVNTWSKSGFTKLIKKYFDVTKVLLPFPWQMYICQKKKP